MIFSLTIPVQINQKKREKILKNDFCGSGLIYTKWIRKFSKKTLLHIVSRTYYPDKTAISPGIYTTGLVNLIDLL